MGIISEAEVREQLVPFEPDLLACVSKGVDAWRVQGVRLVARPRGRFRSNYISGLIENEVRMRFGDVPGIRLIDEGQRLLLGVNSRFLVQFKVVNAKHQTSNYPTATALAFNSQSALPNFGSLPRVTVGYRLNRLGLELLEAAVIFSIDNKEKWSYPIDGGGYATQMSFFRPNAPASPANQGTQRIRVKVQKRDDNEGGET